MTHQRFSRSAGAAILALAEAATLRPGIARAADDDATVAVAARVLAFRSDAAGGGTVPTAVVFNPADPASRAEAARVAAAIGRGGDAAALRATLLAEDELRSGSPYRAVFAAGGLDEAMLRRALAGSGAVCLTTHAELVLHGACAIAIRSEPSVSITFSTAGADNEGVHFAVAFRMMVHEV